jgi:hypothetical protein
MHRRNLCGIKAPKNIPQGTTAQPKKFLEKFLDVHTTWTPVITRHPADLIDEKNVVAWSVVCYLMKATRTISEQ